MPQKHVFSRRSFVQQSVASAGFIAASASPSVRAEEPAPAAPGGQSGNLLAHAGTEVDLIDRRWVEHTYFLTRKVAQLERFSNDPVIADKSLSPNSAAAIEEKSANAEREDEVTPRVAPARGSDPGWGGNPASAMGAVHPIKDGLAMWYVSPHRVEEPSGRLIRYDKVVRYAVSTDGKTFTQPNLGLYSFQGSTDNNIVIGMNQVDAHGVPLSGANGCSGFCVIDATRRPFPHARGRYTALYGASVPKRGGGLCLAWSDDGLIWNAYPENPLTPASDTYCNFHYDPRSKRYAIYIRPTSQPDGRRAGPAGVRSLLSRIESTDLLHWENERVVFDTDEADAPAQGTLSVGQKESATDVPRGRDIVCYGMTVTPHQDIFLGMANLYNTSTGLMWTELVHSYDGLDWRREPRREPFIPIGPEGAWDSGMIAYVAAGGPAPVGEDWFIYYTGNNWTHHFKVTALPERGRMFQIGGLRLKRGRLVGYHTGMQRPDVELKAGRAVPTAWANRGELLTRPFLFDGSAIHLNADAGKGHVVAEICDPDGKSLPGFSREEASPLQADGVRLPLTYRGSPSLAGLRGQTIRLRLHLESAAVFGLSFA